MFTLELTAKEVEALSALLNVAVKQIGISSETTHAFAIHKKIEKLAADANAAASAEAEQPMQKPN